MKHWRKNCSLRVHVGQRLTHMCGIAGIIDLAGNRRQRTASSDEWRARSFIAVRTRKVTFSARDFARFAAAEHCRSGGRAAADDNEDRSVFVVFNGELFDYPENGAELVRQGHRLGHPLRHRNHPAPLGRDSRRYVRERLRGQFALALWDERRRQLGAWTRSVRHRPLYWSRQGDWLLFASEIKALLASGMVPARPDRAVSITCSPLPRCRDRRPVSKECNFCRLGIFCK